MSEEPKRTGPVTLGEIATGVRDEFTQWDRGFIGTFIAMIWKPAAVARGFLVERDPRYAKPWRYLIFSIVVNVAATWFALEQLGLRDRLRIGEQHSAQLSLILDNAALLTLLILPLAALAMRLFFVGLKVRYVDALVVLFYTQAQSNLYSLISLAGLAILGRGVVDIPLAIFVVVYMLWAWASFATGPWWRRILAAIITLIATQALNAAIVSLAILIFT
jgi:hypothetical protein